MSDQPTRDEREALLAEGADRALEPEEASELALLADLLADPSTWAEPRAGLEDAVVRAIADADPQPAPAVTPIAKDTHQSTWSRRRVAWLGVAAAVVVALAVSVVAIVSGGGGARRDYTAQLSATGLVPGAHASADIARNGAGFRVTLDAHGLPKLHGGEYYQAWLKNAAGTLVPIGTFSSSDGRVTLWSGVSPARFPALSVTIEASDGDEGSSGRRVLTGAVRANR
jgi:hypothetical protein